MHLVGARNIPLCYDVIDGTSYRTDSDWPGEYPPMTNVASLIDCHKCLVCLDSVVSAGRAAIRPITRVVVWAEVAGYYISVEAFVAEQDRDGDVTFTRDDVCQLSIHTGLSKQEVATRLKQSGLKAAPIKEVGGMSEPKFIFNAGGTFGWGGLR